MGTTVSGYRKALLGAFVTLGACALLMVWAPCASAAADAASDVPLMPAASVSSADDAVRQDADAADGTLGDDIDDVTGDVRPESPTTPNTPESPDAPADAEDPGTSPIPEAPDEPSSPDVPEQPGDSTPSYEDAHVNVYRLYNPNSGEHFYTLDLNEAQVTASAGWHWEGVGWVAPVTSPSPVYRLYNPNAGDHHYTLDANEYAELAIVGWLQEGISWYSDPDKGRAIYRQYNPNAAAGAHNFTADVNEDVTLGGCGWTREGVAWHATDGDALALDGFWFVSPGSSGALERHWVSSDGSLARGRLVTPDEGAGYMAYATPDGVIVTGRWDNKAGYVYVADNEGRLASTVDGATGWLVTDAYDGQLERYYYDADRHAMRSGLFEIDGKQYYGTAGRGSIARNTVFVVDGTTYLADNDGVLTETQSEHDITLARASQELAACTSPDMSAGDKLRAAFNHIRDDFGEYNPRIPHMKELGWETVYANDMFVGRGGNCFSYGAAFAFMAKAIGFNNVYACNSGGHGWAEVDGLVYDPEWERANRGQSYYGRDYATTSSPNYKVVLGGADWMRVAI